MDIKLLEKIFLRSFITGYILLSVFTLIIILCKDSFMLFAEGIIKMPSKDIYSMSILLLGMFEILLYTLFLTPFISIKTITTKS